MKKIKIPVYSGNVTGSSSYRPAYFPVSNLFDNSNSSMSIWETNYFNNDEWVKIHFNEPTRVDDFLIKCPINYRYAASQLFPSSCRLYACNDGHSWNELTITKTFFSHGMEYKVDNLQKSYTYYKLLFPKFESKGFIISEIELYMIQRKSYIIKQDKKVMFINSNHFTIIEGSITPNMFKEYGFNDINDLFKPITVGGETFKPIDKLDDEFDILMMKEK